MSFELKILGSSSATPVLDRHHTSQLLTFQNHSILIDCGEATQYQLIKYKIKPHKLDYIFISHLHGDHYLGLVGLLSSMHLLGRTRPLHLFGPAGLDEIITIQLKYSATILQYPLHFHYLSGDQPEVILEEDSYSVTSLPLHHRIPCHGFLFKEKDKPRKLNKDKLPEDIALEHISRLRDGEDIYDEAGDLLYRNNEYTLPPKKSLSYAYCSDTAYYEPLLESINKVDLLYHEATFDSSLKNRAIETFHSTAADAATIALKAQAGKLVIGHFSSRYRELDLLLEEASAIFPNTVLGKEGLHLTIEDSL